MRAALYLLLWLSATACGFAQQQEPKLLNRLLDGPDKKFANPMSGKSFNGTPDLKIKGANAQNIKSFETKDFASQSFSTRSFFGVKNPWFGNKVYDTKSDEWSKKTLADAKSEYQVETAQTREFAQAKKGAALTDTPVATRAASVQPKAQGALDATKKNLSIDEVREILNKNH